jgi:hypothetical protein
MLIPGQLDHPSSAARPPAPRKVSEGVKKLAARTNPGAAPPAASLPAPREGFAFSGRVLSSTPRLRRPDRPPHPPRRSPRLQRRRMFVETRIGFSGLQRSPMFERARSMHISDAVGARQTFGSQRHNWNARFIGAL